MSIDFVYEDEMQLSSQSYEKPFQKIIQKTLDVLHIEDDVELSCIIVDDAKIHEINRDYRHIDRSTDVISFALEDNEQFYVEGMPRTLGDIFISYEHACRQAQEYGHSLEREMCFLMTHGLLHLLGYDHMSEEEEKEMTALQKKILDELGMERVTIDYQKLVDEAFVAAKQAYVPYSHFPVGACLLLKNGQLIHGTNIENAAYGSTMCAERNAVYQAYCQGYRKEDIEALAIVGDCSPLISPCGACRQVLAELLEKQTPIILGDKDHYEVTCIEELLPRAFTGESL